MLWWILQLLYKYKQIYIITTAKKLNNPIQKWQNKTKTVKKNLQVENVNQFDHQNLNKYIQQKMLSEIKRYKTS